MHSKSILDESRGVKPYLAEGGWARKSGMGEMQFSFAIWSVTLQTFAMAAVAVSKNTLTLTSHTVPKLSHRMCKHVDCTL